MTINPFIIGSGRAANALKKSMTLLNVQYPELKMNQPVQIERNAGIYPVSSALENPVLIIANPPGLHATSILQGVRAGFRAILVEKPSCVNLKEIESLQSVQIPVAVCHVYRQMWGIQTLKQMLDAGEFGELVCIEGRYWQSSTAQRAIEPQKKTSVWKNDSRLSGEFDALLDVGTHWVDAAVFLMGCFPSTGNAWLSYANSETPHRDSHVHLNLEFPNGKRCMTSISKTFHGATNHFEINVIGTQKSATWTFLNPDELILGRGNTRTILARKETQLGSQQPPFHGLGWLEGYMEITRQVILDLQGPTRGNYPKLQDNLKMIRAMLSLKRNSQ